MALKIKLDGELRVDHYHHDSHREHDNKQSGYFSSITISEEKTILLTLKGKLQIMALSMTDTQQAAGVLSFVDKKGNATDVPDGNVTVTSSDTNVASVSYDDPSNTITVVAGVPGVAALTIAATDKNGNALPFDDVAIEITAGDAVSGTISFGAPTEQP